MSDLPPKVPFSARDWLRYLIPVRELPLGESKARALIGGNALLLTVLLFGSEGMAETVRSGPLFHAWMLLVVAVPLLAAVLLGMVTAFTAYLEAVPAIPECLAHYEMIAATPREAYEVSLRAVSPEEALDHLLDHNYQIALAAAAKFERVGRSLACLRTAFLLSTILLLVQVVLHV